MKQNWIVTFGHAEIEGGAITHVVKRLSPAPEPTEELTEDGKKKIYAPHTILRSNVEFEQGTISWDAYLLDSKSTCELLLPAEPGVPQSGGSASDVGPTTDFLLAFGLNSLGAPYGFAGLRNWRWEAVEGTGQGTTVPVRRWINVAARVTGSSVEMYVDGVRVLSTTRTLRRGQVGLFMQGATPIKFRNLVVEAQQPTCFTVMQFSEDFNVLYTDVIKPMCEQFGYRVIRGDDFHTSGQIMDDITQSIRSAALIIADVTPDNANVFYELGYAHGIGKPTILLSDRRREKLPFDISGFRTLFYDNSIGGKAVVEQRLKQHLEALRSR